MMVKQSPLQHSQHDWHKTPYSWQSSPFLESSPSTCLLACHVVCRNKDVSILGWGCPHWAPKRRSVFKPAKHRLFTTFWWTDVTVLVQQTPNSALCYVGCWNRPFNKLNVVKQSGDFIVVAVAIFIITIILVFIFANFWLKKQKEKSTPVRQYILSTCCSCWW